MIAHLIARYRDRQAKRRLQQLVDQTRASEKHRAMLKRRAAALRGLAIKRERQHNG